jgi:septal ring factor EnvC (AmiA/AmiB activator)
MFLSEEELAQATQKIDELEQELSGFEADLTRGNLLRAETQASLDLLEKSRRDPKDSLTGLTDATDLN